MKTDKKGMTAIGPVLSKSTCPRMPQYDTAKIAKKMKSAPVSGRPRSTEMTVQQPADVETSQVQPRAESN